MATESRAVGRFISDERFAAVFSSPLRRAVATAKPLCEAAGITMQLKEGLKEIAYGQWEGKTPEAVNREFHDDYVRWLADPGWNAPPGGESRKLGIKSGTWIYTNPKLTLDKF